MCLVNERYRDNDLLGHSVVNYEFGVQQKTVSGKCLEWT